MNTAKKVAATAVATAVLSGTALVGNANAVGGTCSGKGNVAHVTERTVTDPSTGKRAVATVTECSGSRVTPAVGVDFRDDNGFKTGSGLSPNDRFVYLGEPRMLNGEMMVMVKQTTSGVGGYGSLYKGYIPTRFIADH